MANISFNFEVQGAGQIKLGVTLLDPTPLQMSGLESKTMRFQVTNPLAREIVFPAITVLKEGLSKGKFSVSLLDTVMVISANGTSENAIIIDSSVPVETGDSCTITVQGVEG